MDKNQIKHFLKQLLGAYPSFNPTDEALEVWGRHMATMDYNLAIKRLDKHITTSKFPPSIAEILNPEEVLKKRRPQEDEVTSPAGILNGGYVIFDGH